MDIFSKPPRVKAEEIESDNEGWATRHVVAQMKRTDRGKDWPIIRGLGQQLCERNHHLCLLHLTDHEALRAAWQASSSETRGRETKSR